MATQIVIDQDIIQGYRDHLTKTVDRLLKAESENQVMQARMQGMGLLTIEQACKYLSVSESTLHYYRSMGLPYYRKGKDGIWFKQAEVDQWVSEGHVNRRKN